MILALSKIPSMGRALSSPWVQALAGVLALVWVLWPTLTKLAERWAASSQYSHGYLVPLFALFLLWWRRDQLAGLPLRPHWGGLVLLLAGLALRAAGTYSYFQW